MSRYTYSMNKMKKEETFALCPSPGCVLPVEHNYNETAHITHIEP